MVEDVAEKTWEGFDPEQYWAPVSHRRWHIILIPLFLGWLVVWMAATFIAGMLWLAREIMQGILRGGVSGTSERGRQETVGVEPLSLKRLD